MKSLISLLIPVYNAQGTLEECLESIRGQSYDRYEVVVVDDGSQDQTSAILARFAARDRRLKIHRFSRNQGIVKALNYGLNHCRGEFIARMDADDRLLPERLALQLQFARTHPEVDLIGARFRLFREDAPLSPAQLRYQRWSNRLLDDKTIKSEIFVESPIAHPTFFARKTFFEAMDGYRDVPWAEDYDFLLRAWRQDFVFAKVPLALMEKRDSLTRLYRTDPRYKRRALLQTKAHFFAQVLWPRQNKPLYLIGSGSSGRTVAAALRGEGIAVAGFIDHRESPRDRTVMGIPAWHRHGSRVQALLNRPDNSFFILCIGNVTALTLQEVQLKAAGLKPGRHYLRFL